MFAKKIFCKHATFYQNIPPNIYNLNLNEESNEKYF